MVRGRGIGLMIVALLAAAPVMAQSSAPPPPQGGAMGNGNVDSDVKSLTAALGLSAVQQADARQILSERQTQVRAVRAEFPAPRPGASPPPGGPVKMRAVMAAAHTKMLAILTPAQQTAYNKLDTSGMGPPPAAP